MRYLIGMDIGTSAVKTVLYDLAGNEVRSFSAEYPLYQPENGYAEQEPEDWWRAVCTTLQAVTAEIDPQEIGAVGLSGQMHGVVMLDADGNVIRRAILWCDSRTGEECREITEAVGKEKLIRITANPALVGFSAGKIRWLQKHEPRHYEACRHILLPKDYIRYRLTGVFATEVSDASGTQLLDVPNRCWSDEMLHILRIDREKLPEVFESTIVSGKLTADAAEKTGLCAGTPVVGGGGDNACSAVGTGVVTQGKCFASVGTSGVIYAHTDTPHIDPEGRVHTFCCAVPGKWHVMGVTQAAGLSLKWARDTFCEREKQCAEQSGGNVYDIINAMAAESPIGSNRLLYLPYLMGERTPHLDPQARGVFFGLSAMHTKADLMRAVMEGVAFSLSDCIHVCDGMGIQTTHMALCGGGASGPVWRGIMADVFGMDVRTLSPASGAPLGAALLAGVGCGAYRSVEEAVQTAVHYTGQVCFDSGNHRLYQPYYALYRDLYAMLKPGFVRLAAM